MGAVDLVIQVESPKSVARGLQRIGRAGHELGAVSKGRIFPKFRADLLESAVVARAMRDGAIEETAIPRNPLDVLAQQIVAIWPRRRSRSPSCTSSSAAPIRSRRSRASSSRTCSTCSPAATRRTSSPSCARASSGTAPRASSAAARARAGSRSRTRARSPTAASSASTSSTAAAASASSTRRWSTRRGRARRSCSAPRRGGSRRSRATACSSRRRPASPARCRSGRARASGGRTSSARRSAPRRASSSRSPTRRRWRRLRADYHLDERAARNLLAFLREQEAATGAVPSDRTIVVERFRDEIGDWRVCILTPFGGRVHAPWAMALAARLRDGLGLEVQSIWSDDGIALHLPDADAPPPVADLLIDPDEIEELVVQEVGQTALFGARFRENAARALLIPRRRPGQRTPLWQQRLKAQSLLQVARKYGSFPIVLETYRECLQDVFDLPALRRSSTACRRASSTSSRSRPRPPRRSRPRSSSTTSRRTCTRTTRRRPSGARRRSRSTATCCASCSARRSCASCSTATRSRRSSGRSSRRRGTPTSCTTCCACAATASPASTTRASPRRCCASVARSASGSPGEDAIAAAEDAGRYRDALGVMPPGGLPDAFLEGGAESLRQLVLRFARGRGPFTTAEVEARFGVDVERLLRELERAERSSAASCGRAAPSASGATPRCCAGCGAPRSPRCGREVEPAEQAALGRFLPAWHGIDRRATLREALVPLQGLPLPVSLWESEVLPRRVPGYQPASLDALCASGELVWVGAGLDRVAVYFREDAPRARPPRRAHRRPRARLRTRSAVCSAERRVLVPARRGGRARGGARAAGALGARLGRRGDERRVDAAARGPPLRVPRTDRTGPPPLLAHPRHAGHGDAGPLVAHRPALSRASGPARARGAPARAPGHRHARRRPRRGHRRRLRRGLRRAEGARDDRRLPPRLLRRGARRRAVRARRARSSGCASCAPRRSPSRSCSRRPIRPSRTARRFPWPKRAGRPRRARRRCAGRPARRRGGALRRARRPDARAAARPDEEWLRPALEALVEHVRGGGAKRLAVERFDGDRWPRPRSCRCSSRPASSPARAAPCCGRSPGGRYRRAGRARRRRRRAARSPARTPVGWQQRRHARLAARRVVAVDEVRRADRGRRARRAPARARAGRRSDVDTAARGLVGEPEAGAVGGVDREPDRPPAPAARHGLAEHARRPSSRSAGPSGRAARASPQTVAAAAPAPAERRYELMPRVYGRAPRVV